MNFPDGIIDYNLIWFGEIHGIKENYLAYKILLPRLENLGFKTILWEMPSDFSSESSYTEDGRINSFSVEFLEWAQSRIKIGGLENIILFGNRKPKKKNGPIDYEKTMAEEILDIISHNNVKKYVVITGNYHAQKMKERHDNTRRCIDYVESELKLKILSVKIKYYGGSFYNYGLKKILISSTPQKSERDMLELSSIDKDIHAMNLRVSKARAVFKNPTTK